MGTMLYAKGFFLNVCYDELSLKQPRLVREVHEEYVRAGAELLETNTFGANPAKLGSYGLADDTEKINRAAVDLARAAAAQHAAVVGAIGPLGIRIEPFGPTSREEAEAAVERLVKATDRPISGQPNAGLPKDVGDRKIYLASPEYMASYARRMIEAGARFVGGCCG